MAHGAVTGLIAAVALIYVLERTDGEAPFGVLLAVALTVVVLSALHAAWMFSW